MSPSVNRRQANVAVTQRPAAAATAASGIMRRATGPLSPQDNARVARTVVTRRSSAHPHRHQTLINHNATRIALAAGHQALVSWITTLPVAQRPAGPPPPYTPKAPVTDKKEQMLVLLNMYQQVQKQAPGNCNATADAGQRDVASNSIVQITDMLANLEVDSENMSKSEHVTATRSRLAALVKLEDVVDRCIASLEPQTQNATSSQCTEPRGGVNSDRLYSDIASVTFKIGVQNGKRYGKLDKMIVVPGKETWLRVELKFPINNQASAQVGTETLVRSKNTHFSTRYAGVYQNHMRAMNVPNMTNAELKIEMFKKIGQKVDGNKIRLLNGTVATMPGALAQ